MVCELHLVDRWGSYGQDGSTPRRNLRTTCVSDNIANQSLCMSSFFNLLHFLLADFDCNLGTSCRLPPLKARLIVLSAQFIGTQSSMSALSSDLSLSHSQCSIHAQQHLKRCVFKAMLLERRRWLRFSFFFICAGRLHFSCCPDLRKWNRNHNHTEKDPQRNWNFCLQESHITSLIWLLYDDLLKLREANLDDDEWMSWGAQLQASVHRLKMHNKKTEKKRVLEDTGIFVLWTVAWSLTNAMHRSESRTTTTQPASKKKLMMAWASGCRQPNRDVIISWLRFMRMWNVELLF